MIDWMDVRNGKTIKQDVRIALSPKGDYLVIAIKRGLWITKLHRADKIAVGFSTNNGIPTAMYFAQSSSGYAAIRKEKGGDTVGIQMATSKLLAKYPRLKVSELQGDYLLREDPAEKACYISLGAKSY